MFDCIRLVRSAELVELKVKLNLTSIPASTNDVLSLMFICIQAEAVYLDLVRQLRHFLFSMSRRGTWRAGVPGIFNVFHQFFDEACRQWK